MTPAEAGTVAREAGAKNLLLTHLGANVMPEAAVESARNAFAGTIEVAAAGQTYKVGQT
jgi:ribonuclease BN (tRNA processing enzyme)